MSSIRILGSILVLLTFGFSEVKGQQWIANHNFLAGETAIYPQGTFVTNSATVTLRYTAGATMTLQTATTVIFPVATTIYGGGIDPEVYAANTPVNFANGRVIVVAPGTVMTHTTPQTVIRYGSFYGSTVTFVTYDTAATIFFNAPTRPNMYPAGTNPINYYNPGGSTALYGPSAPPLNTATSSTQTVTVTVTGFTAQGWPVRQYRNANTGEVYRIDQTSRDTATVTRTVAAANQFNFLP